MGSFGVALQLIVPLIVSGVLHMVVVKKDLFSFLRIPISEKIFGSNKTYRGFVMMPVLTVLGIFLCQKLEFFENQSLNFSQKTFLGLWLGLFYALFELPNSWFKRRKGIAPGKTPSKNRFVFVYIDQADSVFGCVLAYALWFPELSPVTLIYVLILAPFVHLTFNFLLYILKLRNEAV